MKPWQVRSDSRTGGDVLLEKDAKGKITPFPVQNEPIKTKLPLVVMIDEGSASASEIVSGALQDAKRAQLVERPPSGRARCSTSFRFLTVQRCF